MGIVGGLITEGLNAAQGATAGKIRGQEIRFQHDLALAKLAEEQALREAQADQAEARAAYEEGRNPTQLAIAAQRAQSLAQANALKYQGLMDKLQNDQVLAGINGYYRLSAAQARAQGQIGAAKIRAGAPGRAGAANASAVTANMKVFAEQAKELAAQYPDSASLAQAAAENPELAQRLRTPVQVDPNNPNAKLSLGGAITSYWKGEGYKYEALGVKAVAPQFGDAQAADVAARSLQTGAAAPAEPAGVTLRGGAAATGFSPQGTTHVTDRTGGGSPAQPAAAPATPPPPKPTTPPIQPPPTATGTTPGVGQPGSPGAASLNLSPVSQAQPLDMKGLVLKYGAPHGLTEDDLPDSLTGTG